jgi:hypothetical protein
VPNRIIKDTIAKSEKVNGLTDFQFRLWVHLITYVDDYGRGDARPAIIKGSCFPFRDRMTNKDIEKGLADLAGAGCVGLYTVDGKPYLYFPNWEQHQRVRSKISKCPAPTENNACQQLAATCGDLQQNAPVIQNPESRIQNPESRTNSRAREDCFETFWKNYPRKEGKEKARKAFAKVSAPIDVLLAAVEQHKKSTQWTKDNGQFIPHPATWLNGKRWEDQLEPDAAAPNSRELDADEVAAIQRMLQEDLR